MFECSNVYSVWDKRLVRGIKNYRRLAKTVEYKGTRDQKKNEKVFSFEDTTTDLLKCLGVKNMYPGILEADDVVSWLAKKVDGHKVIVSVDQDMLQLVDDKTDVYSPIKDVLITKQNFEEVVGVSISQFLRYKSLIGDKSDNLPGVERVGKKTAQKIIATCPTDDLLCEKYDEQKLEPYFNNLKMIDLTEGHRQHPEDVQLYEEQYIKLQEHQPDMNKFEQIVTSMNMQAITSKLHEWNQCFSPIDINRSLENIVKNLKL